MAGFFSMMASTRTSMWNPLPAMWLTETPLSSAHREIMKPQWKKLLVRTTAWARRLMEEQR